MWVVLFTTIGSGFLTYKVSKTEIGKKFIIGRGQCVEDKIGFFRMCIQWGKDGHNKVCTLVDIKGDNE